MLDLSNCFVCLTDDAHFDDALDHSNVLDQIEPGGRYENKLCKSHQRIALIIPFRNRHHQLPIFLKHMHTFLVQQNAVSHQIFVVEQLGDGPFNRGALLNIGFDRAIRSNHFDCIVFHDVDMLPTNLNQLYTCSPTPRHLCSYLDKFRYVLIYPQFFGGVTALRPGDLKRINGLSNLYQGWGGEDDDFYRRVALKFDHIERYSSRVGACRTLRHRQATPGSSIQRLLHNSTGRSDRDGLNTLNQSYSLQNIETHKLYMKLQVLLSK